MFELTVSMPAGLLHLKDLNCKSESLKASLKDIKCSVHLDEAGGIFFAREEDFLLIFSALGKFFFFFLYFTGYFFH